MNQSGGCDDGQARAARDYSVVANLVAGAKEGDRQAWDALVERYAPLIWCICRRYGISGPGAEDVAQYVWLHLVESLNNLRDPAALPGWISTTTRRECCRIRRVPEPVAAEAQILENLADVDAKPCEHELVMAERQATLREAFARLPLPSQRLLALLVADPPVPYAEISARLGIPVGSIGPNRSRSLDRLRRDPAIVRLINSEGDGEAGPGACVGRAVG
jgi:RNA polymerase sigma factor (sigma-70 family)